MIKKVIAYVEKYQMLQQNDNVVVGVSGGPDSICLLSVLKELSSTYQLNLQAVHINHMLRGKESNRDEAFTKGFCQSIDIPCNVFRYPVASLAKEQKTSTEEMGRQVRYASFEKVLKEMGGGKIAVAHHMDDRAETMLLNLFRGTSLNGLASIRPVREGIIRPLLCLTSQEIHGYLQEKSIPYVEDSTNAQDDYTRNKIRHHVLSYVNREINGNVVQAMNRTATRLAQMEEYFQRIAREQVEAFGRVDHHQTWISLESFCGQEPLLQTYIVMECIRSCKHPLQDITQQHIVECCDLASREVGKTLALPKGLRVKKEYDGLLFYKVEKEAQKDLVLTEGEERIFGEIPLEHEEWTAEETVLGEIQLEGANETFQFTRKTYIKSEKIPNSSYTKWFDYDKIKNRVVLRTRKTGDYMVVNDQGGKKRLKDYFINEKVPKELRDQIPVLAEGSHVLWVVGYRMSEEYKVTEHTEHLLIVTRKNREDTKDE